MGGCDLCDGDNRIPFTCNECGGQYCSDHRLPEAHHCSALQSKSDKEWFKGELSARHNRQSTKFNPNNESRSGFKADSGQDRGLLTKTLGVVFIPFVLAYMLLSGLLRHWKLIAILGIIITPIGMATTGQLDSITDPEERTAGDTAGALDVTVNTDSSSGEAGTTTNSELNYERVEELVHKRINDRRQEHDLSPLNHDPKLREVANQYSRKMATEGFYGHESPSGNDFEDRYEEAGYSCRVNIRGNRYVTGAENIQYTYAFADVQTDSGISHYDTEEELADGLVDAWMNSPGHRENILKPYWNNEGIGVYATTNPDGAGMKVYATQNFC